MTASDGPCEAGSDHMVPGTRGLRYVPSFTSLPASWSVQEKSARGSFEPFCWPTSQLPPFCKTSLGSSGDFPPSGFCVGVCELSICRFLRAQLRLLSSCCPRREPLGGAWMWWRRVRLAHKDPPFLTRILTWSSPPRLREPQSLDPGVLELRVPGGVGVRAVMSVQVRVLP